MKNYKKNHLILSLIIFALIGCKSSIEFYVNDSTTITIPTQSPINLPFNIPTPPISSTNTQEFQNNKTTPDLIQEVSLEKLTTTITNPSNQTFSVLKNIAIYIEKSDGSDKVKIAYLENINSTSKTLELTSTGANLVPYLKESSYKLETEYTVKEYFLQDVDIKIDLKFRVKAKLL